MRMGWFTLASAQPPLSLEVMMGDGTVIATGYGGWEEVPRPRRVAMTVWNGIAPLRLAIPVLIDGLTDGRSVEADVRLLERLAGLDEHVDEPPTLTVNANGAIPHDLKQEPHNRWVVELLEWGDALRQEDGQRIRQEGDLTLLQFIEDEHLRDLKPPAHRRRKSKKGKHGHGTYVVKRGDTLQSIAAKKLGSSKRWHDIAKLNKIRDPKRIHVGQKLKLP